MRTGNLFTPIAKNLLLPSFFFLATLIYPGYYLAYCHEQHVRQVPIKDLKMDKAFGFDPAKGEKGFITYTIDEPGLVTIRVLKNETRELYLATVLNLEHRDAGTHTESWDGKDYHGNPVDPDTVSYIIGAEGIDTAQPGTAKGVEYREGMKQAEVLPLVEGGHSHGRHADFAEEVPYLSITSPKKDDVLAGLATIKVAVDKEHRGYGDKHGYGVRYYVDYELLAEEFYKPECGGEFDFALDTTAFKDGKHLLHVGMCDHNDHVSSHGIEVVVDNAKFLKSLAGEKGP